MNNYFARIRSQLHAAFRVWEERILIGLTPSLSKRTFLNLFFCGNVDPQKNFPGNLASFLVREIDPERVAVLELGLQVFPGCEFHQVVLIVFLCNGCASVCDAGVTNSFLEVKSDVTNYFVFCQKVAIEAL